MGTWGQDRRDRLVRALVGLEALLGLLRGGTFILSVFEDRRVYLCDGYSLMSEAFEARFGRLATGFGADGLGLPYDTTLRFSLDSAFLLRIGTKRLETNPLIGDRSLPPSVYGTGNGTSTTLVPTSPPLESMYPTRFAFSRP